MAKKILLIGYNFYPEPTGIGKYSGEMINWFVDKGYECTVVTAYPYYPYWQVQEPYNVDRYNYRTEISHSEGGGTLTIYRCPMYIPQSPTGLKRMLADFSFLLSASFKTLQLIKKDSEGVVITVAPSFLFGLTGILYRKVKGTRLVYHIQDMQIEAARDLKMIKSKFALNILFSIESLIFKYADFVTSISERMVEKIQLKANKPVHLFPNWVNTSAFYPVENRDQLKLKFGFSVGDKIALYSGAIGEKQGLEAILYAAQEAKLKNVKFLICGSGPYKENLQGLARTLRLDNVIFFPLQPTDKFNDFLNMADVHLVIQKGTASDLVMPSKLTNILAVGGLALITANDGSGLHSVVSKYRIGLLISAENQEAFNEGIHLSLAERHETLRQNARSYAKEYLAIDAIMSSFEKLVF
jgi:colanic acid biosynthesis glycosyl transferase WcaI